MCESICDKHFVSECSVCLAAPMGCIYHAVNVKNGRGYVGQHSTPNAEVRWERHLAVASWSKTPFHRALARYKVQGFTWEVVWRGPISKLNEMETRFIKKLHTLVDEGGYNLTLGGEGGAPSETMRKKRNKAIRKAWAEKTPEELAAHGAMLKTVFAKPEQRAARSEARRLDWQKPSYRKKMARRKSNGPVIRAIWLAKTPEEQQVFKDKMSVVNQSIWANASPEKRQARIEAVRRAWTPKKRRLFSDAVKRAKETV